MNTSDTAVVLEWYNRYALFTDAFPVEIKQFHNLKVACEDMSPHTLRDSSDGDPAA